MSRVRVLVLLVATVLPSSMHADSTVKSCRRACKAPFVACANEAKTRLREALAACSRVGASRATCRREAKLQAKAARGACGADRAECRTCCRASAGGECPSECDAVSGMIGPSGGSLVFCGARLDVLPAAVAAPTSFRIERVEPVPAPQLPMDWAVSGAAYRFSSDDVPLMNWVRITLPHGQPGGVVAPYALVGGEEVAFVEPCSVDDASVSFDGLALGTFLPLHETVEYPPNVSRLGGGVAIAELGGARVAFELDDAPSYAVHIVDDGGMTVEVSGTQVTERVHTLRLSIRWDPATSEGSLIAASFSVFEGGALTLWSEIPGAASIEMTSTGTDAFQASLSIPVRTSSQDEATLGVAFTVTTERWRWPFELACATGFE